MRIPTTDLPSIIGEELNIARKQANATIKLLDDGATVPFIARYRKEATGGLDEKQIFAIQSRLAALREYLKRREFVVEQIRAAGALTPELADRIEHTLDPAVLEDIYLPFKPKRRTRAEMARERGLEPLAKIIMAQNATGILRSAAKFAKGEVASAEEAVAGAQDIIAEWMSENEKARNIVRSKYQRSAQFSTKQAKDAPDDRGLYASLYDYSQPLRMVPSHRYLAARRGEETGVLKVDISINDDEMTDRLGRFFVKPSATEECADIVTAAVRDSYRRLLRPSIENEVAAAAKEKADRAAIDMFSDNLRQLLMAPPMFGKRVMGIDPGISSGCKVVCLDPQGNLLANDIFHHKEDPHGATYLICSLVANYRIDVIAVGSGTGGRDCARFLEDLRFPRKVDITMVNEDGASVYSASEIAREEFPDKDITVRGAVSIGRRLLDPLAELVKIDPKSIGVGQYQHDVDQTKLKAALDFTVESCVNSVGINVNTASSPLLSYVSGIGAALARYIVDYRRENGPFKSRQELMNVPRMGEKAFQQCAGFLRIPDAENPLDNTAIHPERYELVERMASDLRTSVDALVGNPALAENIETASYIDKSVGVPTIDLIIEELSKPRRDPRGEAETTEYDDSLRSIRDIRPGMSVSGKVNNITAFGAFVDLGIKENGLLHVSQMSERFVNSPYEVVRIGQTIRARVLEVDPDRGRIALTLKGMETANEL